MPRAEAVEVGACACPVCGSKKARLRVSGKQLAYIVCNACNVQIFARSDASDSMLRASVVESVKADPPAVAAPVAAPVAAAPKPAPVAAPKPAEEPAGWGFKW